VTWGEVCSIVRIHFSSVIWYLCREGQRIYNLGVDMASTFADESWGKNFWFEHLVLAHVDLNQDLDWYSTLYYYLKKKEPDVSESKAYKAIDLLDKLDEEIQKRIWKSLQDTIIAILDPKKYIKILGIEVLPNADFRMQYEGKEIIVNRGDGSYSFLNTKLQKYLARWILEDSPLLEAKISISEASFISPRDEFFTVENILSLINKKDSKNEVMGVIKLAARLFSAFFDLIDPDAKKRIIEQLFQYESDFIWAAPKYHHELLKKSISSSRFFHEGDKQSISIIKRCFDNIETKLSYYSDDSIIPKGIVGELGFKDDIRMQAADWASGIARNIYENKKLKGLKEKFNCIILNGKIT